jgi:glutathione synthase/RimK-type ligase-like ATP-grasp enzyme
VNGSGTFAFETSKASQTFLLERLGVRTPRSVVVSHPKRLVEAARRLAFPLIVKPNVGGSGAGIRRVDDVESLTAAVQSDEIDRGYDGTVLLQEYHPPRGRRIHRIETIGAKYLYGITIHLGDEEGFDLCPADVCRTTNGEEISSLACPADSVKRGLSVENLNPTTRVIDTVERIARATRLDVGGIEFLESDRDGAIYYYDINALSNFVADAPRVVGFDPTERLVDALADRIARRAA